MSRYLFVLLWVFGLLMQPVLAQESSVNASPFAYAPENMNSLSVPDLIRVIEMEYREQSRGRQIPDDQLDFYLDQIRLSNWTFSQIKNDIALSLRGSSDWRPPAGGAWNPRSVVCSSIANRYRECRTPFKGRARLVDTISDTRCVEGRSWGSRPGLVWVDNGCRARFADSGSGWDDNASEGRVFRCESIRNGYRECRKPVEGKASIVRQLSGSRCSQGYSWGQRHNHVWVSKGCGADFVIAKRSSYTVTCVSTNGRLATCAWDRNRGQPELIERLSNARCVAGRDWGFDHRRGLWVNHGCAARFGVRE